LESIQKERAKFYAHFNCCVFVEELNGKLYFFDIITPLGDYNNPTSKDYNCADDSQTSDEPFIIPRYYVLNPLSGKVETILLKNKCDDLIQDGTVICD
jgi:hypothetical protein